MDGTGGSDGGCFEVLPCNYEPGFPFGDPVSGFTPGDAGSNYRPTILHFTLDAASMSWERPDPV
jgi:hypothetical protein